MPSSLDFRTWFGGNSESNPPLLSGLLGSWSSDDETGPVNQFASWLPYRVYLPNEQLFVNRDSVGFLVEAMPQTGADLSMIEVLPSLYSTLPKGAGIQFTLFASPHILDSLRLYGNLRVEDEDALGAAIPYGRPARNRNLFRMLARRRAGHLLKGSHASLTRGFQYSIRDFRLMVSLVLRGGLADIVVQERLLTLRESLLATLGAAKLPGVVCDAADLINWCAILTNPHRLLADRVPRLNYDDGREIRDQIVDFDTVQDATAQGLIFGKPSNAVPVEARFFSIKSFPEQFPLWGMGSLIGDMMQSALQYPCPFILTMGVQVQDPTSMRSLVAANQLRAQQNAESSMAKIMPDVPEKLRDWRAAARALDQGGGLVSMYHSLGLFTTPDRATAAEETARAIWRARGFEINNDYYMHRQSLISSLPMTLSENFHTDLKRMRRVSRKTTANAVHLAPLISEWRGTSTPTLIFGGRRGQLMKLDLYDNDGNRNAVIIGTPGSGKSVLMNEIAWSYRAIGALVRILDLGRSFEKLCRKAGGQFVEFTTASKICINPFTMVGDLEDDMAMLAPAIAKMACLSKSLDEVQHKAIGAAIMRLWKAYGQDMTITALRDFFKSGTIEDLEIHGDQRIRDLAIMLDPYTRDGQYARFFEGRSTIEFDNDFMVIENEELKRAPDLHAVVNMILLYRITQEMYLSRQRGDYRKKLLMIDELMQQLGEIGSEDPVKARVVEEAARRARKYGGALITASQSADDYYTTKQMEAAFHQADWMFLLRQKQESIERLTSEGKIVMDDTKKRLLTSLHTEPGVYSEIYIKNDALGEGVGRLILDPWTLLLFSNRQEDNEAIDTRRAAGMSIDEAIADVLRERGIAA